MNEQRCLICGGPIDLDEIARELGWDDVTHALICARCASVGSDEDPDDGPETSGKRRAQAT
jgi:hypothetical protein